MKIVTVIRHPFSSSPSLHSSTLTMKKNIFPASSTMSSRGESHLALQNTALLNVSATLAVPPANTVQITTLRSQIPDIRWAKDDEDGFFDPCQSRRASKAAPRDQILEEREDAGVQAGKAIRSTYQDSHIAIPSQDFSFQGKRKISTNTTTSDDSADTYTCTFCSLTSFYSRVTFNYLSSVSTWTMSTR